jgi:release factor H-coupled RctB family protein
MPSHRVTLVSNANQVQRITFLLPSPSAAAVLKAAKDKLRLKKPSRIFLPGGDEVTDNLAPHIGNGIQLLISSGEDFVGLRKSAHTNDCEVTVIAKTSFVDPDAVSQLRVAAALPGMTQVVGMPDLHPGTKFPVGAVFVSEQHIYPSLIGGDIGCGMAVYRTDLTVTDVSDSQVQKLADKLRCIEGQWEHNVSTFLSSYLTDDEIDEVRQWETSLGTIGAGNHFAELQQITKIHQGKEFQIGQVVLVVHSGSRGFGQQILSESSASYSTENATEYLRKHHIACVWAKANRDLIALRFLSRISRQDLSHKDVISRKILDIWHNNIEFSDGKYIHRKGAAPATNGMVVIPGSRGTLTAFVQPIPTPSTAFSLAHGAGRSQSRSFTFQKLSKRFRPEDLQRTQLGGWVICEDKQLIYEEAPDGYKDVEVVVSDLVDAGACEVIAWGIPRVSYKVRR